MFHGYYHGPGPGVGDEVFAAAAPQAPAAPPRAASLRLQPRDDRSLVCIIHDACTGDELTRTLVGGGSSPAFDERHCAVVFGDCAFTFTSAYFWARFAEVAGDVERVFALRQLQETLERDVGIPVDSLAVYFSPGSVSRGLLTSAEEGPALYSLDDDGGEGGEEEGSSEGMIDAAGEEEEEGEASDEDIDAAHAPPAAAAAEGEEESDGAASGPAAHAASFQRPARPPSSSRPPLAKRAKAAAGTDGAAAARSSGGAAPPPWYAAWRVATMDRLLADCPGTRVPLTDGMLVPLFAEESSAASVEGLLNVVGEIPDERLLPVVRRYCRSLASRLHEMGLPPAVVAHASHVLLPTLLPRAPGARRAAVFDVQQFEAEGTMPSLAPSSQRAASSSGGGGAPPRSARLAPLSSSAPPRGALLSSLSMQDDTSTRVESAAHAIAPPPPPPSSSSSLRNNRGNSLGWDSPFPELMPPAAAQMPAAASAAGDDGERLSSTAGDDELDGQADAVVAPASSAALLSLTSRVLSDASDVGGGLLMRTSLTFAGGASAAVTAATANPTASPSPTASQRPQLPSLALVLDVPSVSCFLCDVAETRLLASSRRIGRGIGLHPLVPVAQGGSPVLLCSKCHTTLLERRRRAAQAGRLHGSDGLEDLCVCCGAGAATHPGLDVTVCSAQDCPRSYCSECLDRLLLPAGQTALKVQAEWLCPPCAAVSAQTVSQRFEEALASRSGGGWEGETAAAGGHSVLGGTAPRKSAGRTASNGGVVKGSASSPLEPDRAPQPRKQRTAAPVPPALPPVDTTKTPAWWWAQYAKSLAVRRASPAASLPETEDACFFCRDGGDLLECDFHRSVQVAGKQTKFRCPKVYHAECAGVQSGDDAEWECPRHYCQQCSRRPVSSMCKYCPASFCPLHAPSGDKHVVLQPSEKSLDVLEKASLIVCPRCVPFMDDAKAHGADYL